jgi:voltage-gated sodium channel
VFATEMVLKIMGLGFKGYFTDRYNMFDALIILLGIIELIGLSALEGRQT